MEVVDGPRAQKREQRGREARFFAELARGGCEGGGVGGGDAAGDGGVAVPVVVSGVSGRVSKGEGRWISYL